MSGHTPGPWAVAPRTGRYQVIPATEQERYHLASINALEFEALSVGTPNGQMALIPLDESNRANANLIAAAPELLEALEGMLDRYTGLVNCGDCGSWDPESEVEVIDARKAITRAKGQFK